MSFPFKEDKVAAREEAQGLVDKWGPFFTKIARENAASKFMVGSSMSCVTSTFDFFGRCV
jgi:hypothetical protein